MVRDDEEVDSVDDVLVDDSGSLKAEVIGDIVDISSFIGEGRRPRVLPEVDDELWLPKDGRFPCICVVWFFILSRLCTASLNRAISASSGLGISSWPPPAFSEKRSDAVF